MNVLHFFEEKKPQKEKLERGQPPNSKLPGEGRTRDLRSPFAWTEKCILTCPRMGRHFLIHNVDYVDLFALVSWVSL